MAAKRILLVEDEQDIAEILALVLRSEGYTVDIAGTVAQARQRLDAIRYTLVNTDLRLPDGNGLEIVESRRRARSADLYSERIRFAVAGTRCGPARGADEADASDRVPCRSSAPYRASR
jgi:CheY-like chemotaxis protein